MTPLPANFQAILPIASNSNQERAIFLETGYFQPYAFSKTIRLESTHSEAARSTFTVRITWMKRRNASMARNWSKKSTPVEVQPQRSKHDLQVTDVVEQQFSMLSVAAKRHSFKHQT